MSLFQKMAQRATQAKQKPLPGISDERPKEQQITPKDVNTLEFRGLGFTKREMEKSQREYDRETAKSIKQDAASDNAREHWEQTLAETARNLAEEARLQNIVLDPSQLSALSGMLSWSVSVLIGAAGTGKTTLTRMFINELAKKVRTIDLRDARIVTQEDEAGERTRALASTSKSKTETDEKRAEWQMPAIACCAYTGRATQQIKRALDEKWHRSISTAHSLLGYAPVEEEYEKLDPITQTYHTAVRRMFRPTFGVGLKLPYTVYIIDEASMFPILLFNELIDAIHPTSRILLIGDIHQLPPVFGKSVLGYAMQKWPVFELTQIHRQAADNPIIANAHRILNGQKIVADKENVHIISTTPNGSGELNAWVRQAIKKLYDMKRYDPLKDAVIVPQNVGLVGCDELNQHFVVMFNPERRENGVIVNKRITIHTGTNHNPYAVGDKVMILQNINTVNPPITNGMIGIVESINVNGKYDQGRSQYVGDEETVLGNEIDLDLDDFDNKLSVLAGEEKSKDKESMDQRQASHTMLIRFDTGQTYSCSTAGDYRKVKHGYVITCHKSQGGEYPNVIILLHSVNAKMLSREWFYTAFSRARLRVYVFCNAKGLAIATSKQRIKGNSIAEKIKNYVIVSKKAAGEIVDENNPLDKEMQEDDPWNVDRTRFPILFKPVKVNGNGNGNGGGK